MMCLHFQNVDRVLNHGQTIQIGMDDQVRDVAVHKQFAGKQADDLIRRHAAVGAADPEVFGRLLAGEPL